MNRFILKGKWRNKLLTGTLQHLPSTAIVQEAEMWALGVWRFHVFWTVPKLGYPNFWSRISLRLTSRWWIKRCVVVEMKSDNRESSPLANMWLKPLSEAKVIWITLGILSFFLKGRYKIDNFEKRSGSTLRRKKFWNLGTIHFIWQFFDQDIRPPCVEKSVKWVILALKKYRIQILYT